MRSRGLFAIVAGVLLLVGAHGHMWVLYHLVRALSLL